VPTLRFDSLELFEPPFHNSIGCRRSDGTTCRSKFLFPSVVLDHVHPAQCLRERVAHQFGAVIASKSKNFDLTSMISEVLTQRKDSVGGCRKRH